MMNIEKQVLQAVADALENNDYYAEFYSGTLFLKTNEDEARKVFHRLCKLCGLGHIIVSKVTEGEYAYDIV
jgi:hypothetical protein